MRSLSIQWKIITFAGLCLIITAIVLVGYSIFTTDKMQKLVYQRSVADLERSATLQIQAQARSEASQVLRYFDEARYRAEVIAQDVLFLKSQAEQHYLDNQLLRISVNELLEQSITQYQNLLGIYVAFLPNALDKDDHSFVDKEELGSNEQGRFAVYWARDPAEGIVSEVLVEEDLSDTELDENGIPANAWYQCAIDKRGVCILEPYLDDVGDQELLMTSITLPLIEQGEVIGMLGVDIALATLQQFIDKADQQLFSGQGQVILFSHKGIVAAWDGQSERIGQPFSEFSAELGDEFSRWQSQDSPKSGWHQQMLQVYTPINFGPNTAHWSALLQVPKAQILKSASELEQIMLKQQQQNLWTQLLVSILVTLLGLSVIGLVARRIVTPIRQVAERLKDIAKGEGDLTQSIVIQQRDEVGHLAHWFNSFLEKLRGTISEVIDSVDTTRETANNAVQIAQNTSQGMDTQFQEVDLVATASEEMSYSAKEVVENAARAVEAAESADLAAQGGKSIAEASQTSMNLLVEHLTGAVPVVQRLEEDSGNINSILEVIQSIAEQTNLLALNASIEAARAGEHGRGFSVVADEVRNLAHRTQDSIIQIRELIEKLQSGTSGVVSAINRSNDQVGETAEHVREAVKSLEKIIYAVGTIHDMNDQIAKASEEQSIVVDKVNRNVANIRDISESILGETASSTEIGEKLTQLADRLQQLMAQFKV
ncbi:methyl-accepting chemotaxis protein [Dongshaea marina]|uniref:methyl-accepting chemotaxis protein n=1 Tax=Dongshaea marina TaxID=2047966 RepID=UPI000D3E179F|nr:methyl-accepting chemotaxis protein [Dongshaea marina]